MDKKTGIIALDNQYKEEGKYFGELAEQYQILKKRFERTYTLLIADQRTELEYLKKDLQELREITPTIEMMDWRGFVNSGLVTLNRSLDRLITDVMKRSAHLSPAKELEEKPVPEHNRCKHCKNTFTPTDKRMQYCSQKCKKDAANLRQKLKA